MEKVSILRKSIPGNAPGYNLEIDLHHVPESLCQADEGYQSFAV
jgi:hypothetical protein